MTKTDAMNSTLSIPPAKFRSPWGKAVNPSSKPRVIVGEKTEASTQPVLVKEERERTSHYASEVIWAGGLMVVLATLFVVLFAGFLSVSFIPAGGPTLLFAGVIFWIYKDAFGQN